jgi:thioesterase domain-containing protein
MVEFGLGWEVRDLARHLGPDQPVYGLRPVKFLDEGGPAPRVRALAASYVEAVREVRPHGPYILGGGCAAGLVAFEMARQLAAQGESVPLVALFDVDFPPYGALPDRLAIWLMRAPREWARLRELRGAERRAHLRESLRRWTAQALGRAGAGGPAPDAAARLQARLVALRDSAWRYVPQPYGGRIALFLGAGTGVWFHRDRRLDWHRVALGGCEVHVIPGQHDLAVLEPHAAAAAEALRTCIDNALRPR